MIPAKLVALVVLLLPVCSSNLFNYAPTIITHFRKLPSCPMRGDTSIQIMRSLFYKAHNAFRHKVATGQKVSDLEYDHSPRLMTGSTYDCELEGYAREFLDRSDYQRTGHAVNHKEGIVNNRGNWMYELAAVVDEWTKEYDSRTRLMHPYAPYMGCAYKHWDGSDGKLHFKVVCVYRDDRSRSEIPQKGVSCSKNQDCGIFAWDYECLENLCFAPTRTVIYS
ncbi:SCP-like protein [Cooperia oncophora]